jgi:capsid protein
MTLQSLSRRLYTNFGVLKAAVDQKADYSVGHAWQACFRSPDVAGANAAREWTADNFFPLCDIRGGVFDWSETLSLISQGIDRDGEAYVLLTESAGKEPRIQTIPAHRIGQRNYSEKIVESGPYSGMRLCDGVILNPVGRAVAYRVLGDNKEGKDDQDISARDMIHVFDPDFSEQQRGLPAFTHALKDFLHCLQSTDYERIAQLMVSSIGLIEYNEMGGPDYDDPGTTLNPGSTSSTGLTSQLYDGGATRYFKANSGAKLESITHTRPGDMWERFHDRLIRSALAGVRWPMAMVWKSSGQGTAERQEVVRARRAIEQRQATLKKAAKRIISYAVGKAIDRGDLKAFKRFWDVDFTLPPRLTVDDGRENSAMLEQIEAGALTMAEYQGYKGRTEEDHWREYWTGMATKERVRKEASALAGVDLVEEQSQGDGTVTENAMADLKSRFDAYGVGVRAGVITPQAEDEEDFRTAAGLPKPSESVRKLWKRQENTRQPITLVQEGTESQPMQTTTNEDDESDDSK